MAESVQFFVRGTPRPKGSKKAFVVKDKKTGKPRAVLAESAGEALKAWSNAVGAEARAHAPSKPLSGPVCVEVAFHLPRPKRHYTASGALRGDAPAWHAKRPDIDKLARGVLDALTGVLFEDDAQVASFLAKAVYATNGPAGCELRVGACAP